MRVQQGVPTVAVVETQQAEVLLLLCAKVVVEPEWFVLCGNENGRNWVGRTKYVGWW